MDQTLKDTLTANLKAAKRAEKNLSKILKTIEQAKKKASDEDEVALYDLPIEMLTPTDGNGGK